MKRVGFGLVAAIHGYMNADSWDRYHFSVWLHVPYPTATVHWRPHCSL